MIDSGFAGRAHPGKNRDIEVLRAFAILGVLIHHLDGVLLPAMPGFRLGAMGLGSGVDLFFAISGFVIASGLLPRLQSAKGAGQAAAEVLAFWTKRAFRLWPTAWLWLGLTLVVTASFQFQAKHLWFPANVDAAVAGALHFANFRFADSFGQYPYGASFQFWTLSLEEQFYFLLPLLALLSGKRLVFVLPMLIAIELLRPVSLLSIATRSSALMIGVLIAIFSQTRVHNRLSEIFGKLGPRIKFVLMLGPVMLVPWVETATPTVAQLHYGYVAAAAGLCVLLASFDKDGLCPGRTWATLSQWIGARSYAIYVIHVLAFLMIGEIAQAYLGGQLDQVGPAMALAAAVCGLVFILAELNFRLIETPLRHFGVGLAGRFTAAHVGSTAATVA